MHNPTGAFRHIKDHFIRYIETSTATKFDALERERNDLLNADGTFYRQPWLEILTEYASSGKTIDQLSDSDLAHQLNPQQLNAFKNLVGRGLFGGGYALHQHQAEMLKKTLGGQHGIITSGTGSGKTEAFLLPLFAQLVKEMNHWHKPKPQQKLNWWHNNSTKIADNNGVLLPKYQQRNHETRPAAVRALILYPMNALVEDQMTRLRIALDSDEARRFFEEKANGNRLYFGRYNSATPTAGKLDNDKTYKTKELCQSLKDIEKGSSDIEKHIQENPNFELSPTARRAFFPRLDGAEMSNRFDMQATPPDILITNFSMLGVMLMRDVDKDIFEKTRAWLAAEDLPEGARAAERPNRIFHLIIDELHLYRGTSGTEVSYLLKLVLHRLGLTPEHPQLKILASSASIDPKDEKSWAFISQIFGFDTDIAKQKISIIEGQNTEVAAVESPQILPVAPFIKIQKTFDSKDFNKPTFIAACSEAAIELEKIFNIEPQKNEGEHNGLARLLACFTHSKLEMRQRLYAPMRQKRQNTEGVETTTNRTICVFRTDKQTHQTPNESVFFAEKLFGISLKTDDLVAGTEGVFILRALLDDFKIRQDLPRFRCHFFFRNVEGLWASVAPHDVEQQYQSDTRTAGKLYGQMRLQSAAKHRVLELLYCENCGTTLFGGSPSRTHADCAFEMLPLSPRLENVPEKTPAKFIEQRSYQEYAVFWAQGNQEFTKHDKEHGVHQDYWQQASMNENRFQQKDYRAEWVKASLNIFSGDVIFEHEPHFDNPQKWVKGYVFKVSNDNGEDVRTATEEQTHRALPCVCPACGINNQIRKTQFSNTVASPIRDFRRGFGKSVQLLTKELNYQLDNGNQKLVLFSDSREDAATLANDIERSHFNDLVREVLIAEMHENVLLASDIYAAIQNDDKDKLAFFEEKYPSAYNEMDGLEEDSRSRNAQKKRSAEDKLRTKLLKIVSVHDLLEQLMGRFLALGINPAGVDVEVQKFTPVGSANELDWYELFDFQTLKLKGNSDTFENKIKNGLLKELGSTFFGRLFYSLESSGLGYLTFDPSKMSTVRKYAQNAGFTEGVFSQILNALIRALGDKYYYFPNNFDTRSDLIDYTKLPAKVKKYIRAVAESQNKNELTIGEAAFDCLQELGILLENGIQINALFVRVAAKTDVYWSNRDDARPHLQFSAGICTLTAKPLVRTERGKVGDLWNKNYISFHAAQQKRPPIRLHCEELTGQTDDQFERQRHFRKVILQREGTALAREIDVLSVTTTLEVGVDIGALQAIMLANMPPQRFNYQQRVGRAGRRNQAFSVVLTFCRGRSHDEFYFNHPDKMTNDPPPTPFLATQQDRIVRRLIAKETLRQAFKSLNVGDNLSESNNIHGQFGKTADWATLYRRPVEAWLQRNARAVSDIVHALLPSERDPQRLENLINWALKPSNTEGSENADGLLSKMEKIVGNADLQTEDLAQRLAEGGLLPMFGMPTAVRNMYHGIKHRNGHTTVQKIDRTAELAIFEFAPDSQKTKDKAIHKIIGFTNDYQVKKIFNKSKKALEEVAATDENTPPFSYEGWMFRCRSCGYLKTDKVVGNVTVLACPACETLVEDGQIFSIKSPQAYRTDFSNGRDRREFGDIVLSRPPIFTEGNQADSQTEKQENAGFRLELSDFDLTWRVNTNGDKFFNGQLIGVNSWATIESKRSDLKRNQWITEGVELTAYNQGQSIAPMALVAMKNTEVLRLSPRHFSHALDLDMFKNGGKWSAVGVRSAFYSAAFLLQRTLADALDVDPNEIAIADIRRVSLDNDRKTAEIVLTDELANGSGFVRQLFNNFEQYSRKILTNTADGSYAATLHTPEHRAACADACYKCLKVFRNMNFHGLLDWRLGMALIRVLHEADYKVGSDGSFETTELKDWLKEAGQLRDIFVENFNSDNHNFEKMDDLTINNVTLPAIFDTTSRKIIIIVHPLWATDWSKLDKDSWTNGVFVKALQHVDGDFERVRFLDTFNLHHRLGECYKNLYSQ